MTAACSPYADVCLAAIVIALIVSGVTALSICRDSPVPGSRRAIGCLSLFFFLAAAAQSLELYLLSESSAPSLRTVAALLFALSSVPLAAAVVFVRAVRSWPGMAFPAILAAAAVGGWCFFADGTGALEWEAAGAAVPVSRILPLAAALALAFQFRKREALPADVGRALWALVLFAALMLAFPVLDASRQGSEPDIMSPWSILSGADAARIVSICAVAALLWNHYAGAMGMAGGARWRPFAAGVVLAVLGLGLVLFAEDGRGGTARGETAVVHPAAGTPPDFPLPSGGAPARDVFEPDSARTPDDPAPDPFRSRRRTLLLLPAGFLLVLLLLRGQPAAWLAACSASRADGLRSGTLGRDLVGIAIVRDKKIVDVNQRFANILGLRKAELLGRDLFSLFAPDGAPDPGIVRAEVGRGGEARMEASLLRVGNEPARVLASVRRLPPDAPGASRVWEPDAADPDLVWEIVNITRQAAMERRARASRDFLDTIIDAIPVAIFIKAENGRFLLANSTFAKILGVQSIGDIVGRTASELFPFVTLDVAEQDEKCRSIPGNIITYEQSLPDTVVGGRRYFEVTKMFRDVGPENGGEVIIGSIHDLTAQQCFVEAVARERQLLNAIPVSVCLTDVNGAIRLVDDDFVREAGKARPEELIGKPFPEVSPFPDPIPEEDKRLLDAGHGYSDCQFEVRGEKGIRSFVLRRTVLLDQAGEILGIAKTFWDSTAMVAANRAAQAAERAKSAFLSNMSHELRTPMNGIVGMAGIIIERGSTAPETRLGAETILNSAKTLQMVIDEIMDIATVDPKEDAFALEDGAVYLLQLLEDVVRIENCIVEAWGVELFLDFDFDIPPVVHGDAKRVRQILVQVVAHCARVSRSNIVTLSTSVCSSGGDSRQISFKVEFLPDPSTKAAEVEAQFKKGKFLEKKTEFYTKLGIFDDRIALPLAWHLTCAMRGGLAVYAGREGRLVCDVRLPLKQVEGAPERILAPDLSSARVAVLSADPDHRRLLKSCLAYAGAEMRDIGDIASLGECLREGTRRGRPFNLIILDTQRLDGHAVVDFLRAARAAADPDRPRIVLAAHAWDISIAHPLEDGLADGFIQRPLCPMDIWAKAENALVLPASAAAREGRRRTRSMATGAVKFNANVLLVEDNTINQMVGRGILDHLGCRVTLARNGEEAVTEITGGSTYDLILMDCHMPVMDGYEATGRIRRYELTTPGARRHAIVALTANTVRGDRERCLAAGMNDYMMKPITVDAMRDMILRHCPARMTSKTRQRSK